MDVGSFLAPILQTALGVVLGTFLGSIVTGLLINKFVVQKVIRNKDVKDIIKLIKDAKDALIEHNKK